jgi:CBS domain-containing protein
MSQHGIPSGHGSYLLPHFEHATVADAMHPGILSCDGETTVTEVARMMSTHHVHCIVVLGGTTSETDPHVYGIISDLDILRASMQPDGPDTAAEVAREPVINVDTTAALRDAAELMLTHGSSHVLGIDPKTRRPVGILSTLDIAGVLAWGEV